MSFLGAQVTLGASNSWISSLFVCLFVYVDAREIQIETAPPQKKVSLIWDFAFIQNNFNVFYTHQMVGWVVKKRKGRERVGKKARIEPLPPNPTPKMADPKQYLT